jgi:hypothetical protein
MKAKGSETATLGDVKLVLSAPIQQPIKRKHFQNAEVAFLLAKRAFLARATPLTWAATVAAGRQLHAEFKRYERVREAAASRAATDEGGEA